MALRRPRSDDDYFDWEGGYLVGEARGSVSSEITEREIERLKAKEIRKRESGFAIGFQLPRKRKRR